METLTSGLQCSRGVKSDSTDSCHSGQVGAWDHITLGLDAIEGVCLSHFSELQYACCLLRVVRASHRTQSVCQWQEQHDMCLVCTRIWDIVFSPEDKCSQWCIVYIYKCDIHVQSLAFYALSRVNWLLRAFPRKCNLRGKPRKLHVRIKLHTYLPRLMNHSKLKLDASIRVLLIFLVFGTLTLCMAFLKINCL